MFKIRHKITGLYSRGGYEPVFDKKGKVWRGINHVRSHITLIRDSPRSYKKCKEDMKNWEIVEYQMKEINTYTIKD